MFLIALLSFSAFANIDDDSGSITLIKKQTELPIISDDTMSDLFEKYPQRFVVSVAKEDFKIISDKNSKEYAALLECSSYFFDQYETAQDRFALLLLNSEEDLMIDDASTYLNCTQRPCYSLELEEEEGEGGTKAYTRSIKDFGFPYVSENSDLQHDFLGSCKKFVDLYVSESKQNKAEYFIAEIKDDDDDSDDSDVEEGEEQESEQEDYDY